MDNQNLTENDEAVLKAFGGVAKHSLNEVLTDVNDTDENNQTILHSPYFNLDSISDITISKNSSFKTLSINIQSIQAKFDAFSTFLQILMDKDIIFDAILVQETWVSEQYLSQKEYVASFQLPGYNLFHQGKICCGHGGLFTYVRDNYKCYHRQTLYRTSNVYEALYIDITNENLQKKVTLGNIYRPSKSLNDYRNVAIFTKEIEPTIDLLDKENSILILGGDYNANLLHMSTKENFQELFDMFVSRGILPKITLPTRFSSRSATLIDNIYCKLPHGNNKETSGIFVSKISDHFPVFTCQEIFKSK